MDFTELSSSRRTVRRFLQKAVPENMVRHLLDMARYASCGGNKQLLRYVVVQRPELVKPVFETTRWAALVAPRRNPVWGVDAPLCFIAVTAPENAGNILYADAGAAIQTIQLAAREKELGCCWFASFDPEKVQKILQIPPERKVLYLVAVGFPAEDPVTEEAVGGNVAYYLDDSDRLHVPKLPVDEISVWM